MCQFLLISFCRSLIATTTDCVRNPQLQRLRLILSSGNKEIKEETNKRIRKRVSRYAKVWPVRGAVEMGENMSKRLKLVSSSDAEMEERSFQNPFPDWDQGVLVSSGSGAHSSDPFDGKATVRCKCFAVYILCFVFAGLCRC